MRIGYNGKKFRGYQKQKGIERETVEGTLKVAIDEALIAAGRTDKGVSAISQVVNFITTSDSISPEDYLGAIRSLPERISLIFSYTF